MKYTPKNAVEEYERIAENGHWDEERVHGELDDLLCDILVQHGYDELVKKYNDTPKWYA